MDCHNCRKKLPNNAQYCLHCGEKVIKKPLTWKEQCLVNGELKCWSCNAQTTKEANYCGQCQADQNALLEEIKLIEKHFPTSRNKGVSLKILRKKTKQ